MNRQKIFLLSIFGWHGEEIRMKKRRRAYKKYDWQQHSLDLIGKMLEDKIKEYTSVALQITLLYGRNALAYKMEHMETFKAGLWKFSFPLPKPYCTKMTCGGLSFIKFPKEKLARKEE